MPRNYRLSNSAIIAISLLATLSMVGCSAYKPNSTVVPKDKLAEYNPKHFSKKELPASPVKRLKNEDELIIKAIWYEQKGDYKRSNAYYKKLYEETNNEEYLFKELTTALYTGSESKNIDKLKEYTVQKPNDIKAQRLLLSSYLTKKKYEEAKAVATRLLEQSNKAIDYELSANPYIYTTDYSKAVSYLTKAYEISHNEEILLKITMLLGNYMKDIDAAVERLEAHRSQRGCGEKICLQLLDIYQQQNDIDKTISVFESLYEETKDENYAEKLIDAYLYKKEYHKAVDFLKNEYKNKELLYALYIERKEYSKAVELSKELLKETKEPKWYAEAAMAIFESATDKNDKTMLTKVVNSFDKALEAGVENSVYLNYYGYTLIDKDINPKKGVAIIKKALKMEPDNTYYLDSLAWGYYKLNECNKAYDIIKKVIDIEGLKEKELIEHWDAISKKCKR